MPTYRCETCQKEFKQKGHYDSHLVRKRPCTKQPTLEELVQQRASVESGVVQWHEPVKPLIKWVGGKTQLLEEVFALFPRACKNYHEPFLGGGSVLFALLTQKKHGALKIEGAVKASDLNPNLIALYTNVQQKPEEFLRELKALVDEFRTCQKGAVNRDAKTREEALTSEESYYYWIRWRLNTMSKEERLSAKGSAMLVFLNKTCFRGVYREGPNGFNVPFGHNKNPSIYDEAHVREVSTLLQGVQFSCCSFEEALKGVKAGDFIYLDPPYVPETATSFVGYTADGFKGEDHGTLFTQIKSLPVKFLMSNADVPLVRTTFPSDAYQTKIVSARRAIHSKKPDTRTNEVLITKTATSLA